MQSTLACPIYTLYSCIQTTSLARQPLFSTSLLLCNHPLLLCNHPFPSSPAPNKPKNVWCVRLQRPNDTDTHKFPTLPLSTSWAQTCAPDQPCTHVHRLHNTTLTTGSPTGLHTQLVQSTLCTAARWPIQARCIRNYKHSHSM